MKVLPIVKLGYIGDECPLLSLPNQQFLIHSSENKQFYLIDSNDGQLKQTIPYDAVIYSTALINEKCLVIQTDYKGYDKQLRFYDL
jgi:hypothetical protein